MQRRSISQIWLSMKSRRALSQTQEAGYASFARGHDRSNRFFRNAEQGGYLAHGHRAKIVKREDRPFFLGQLRYSASQGQGGGHSPKVTRVDVVMWRGEPTIFARQSREKERLIGTLCESTRSFQTNQNLFWNQILELGGKSRCP